MGYALANELDDWDLQFFRVRQDSTEGYINEAWLSNFSARYYKTWDVAMVLAAKDRRDPLRRR